MVRAKIFIFLLELYLVVPHFLSEIAVFLFLHPTRGLLIPRHIRTLGTIYMYMEDLQPQQSELELLFTPPTA